MEVSSARTKVVRTAHAITDYCRKGGNISDDGTAWREGRVVVLGLGNVSQGFRGSVRGLGLTLKSKSQSESLGSRFKRSCWVAAALSCATNSGYRVALLAAARAVLGPETASSVPRANEMNDRILIRFQKFVGCGS